MNPLDYIQLGIAGIALIVIYRIIKEFLCYTKIQEKNFTSIVQNHLKHNTQATSKLEIAITELIIYLKKNNKS